MRVLLVAAALCMAGCYDFGLLATPLDAAVTADGAARSDGAMSARDQSQSDLAAADLSGQTSTNDLSGDLSSDDSAPSDLGGGDANPIGAGELGQPADASGTADRPSPSDLRGADLETIADLGSADQSGPKPDLSSTQPDLSASADLAQPAADLSLADLSLADLSITNSSPPDLSLADLSLADLSSLSEMFVPDLSLPDGSAGDASTDNLDQSRAPDLAPPSDLSAADLTLTMTASMDLATSTIADLAMSIPSDLAMSLPPDLAQAPPDLARRPDLSMRPDMAHAVAILPSGIFPALSSAVSAHGAGGLLLATDLDNDGISDLVLGDSLNTMASVYLGAPNGGPLPAVDYATGANVGARAFASVDLLADGFPTLVAGDPGMFLATKQVIALLANNGDGTLGSPTISTVAPAPALFATGDFDGDGRADVMVGGGGNLELLVGDGEGDITYSQQYTNVATEMYSLVAADLNRDGKLDLVLSDPTSPTGGVVVMLNQGQGKFAVQAPLAKGGTDTAVADVDGDGWLDLISAGSSVYVFTNQAGGGWKLGATFGASLAPSTVRAAHFHADGHVDLALGGGAVDADVAFFHGKGDGTFTQVGPLYALPNPGGLQVGDFNGDGLLDLAGADPTVGASVLWNLGGSQFFGATHARSDAFADDAVTLPAPGHGDFNGDGLVDLFGPRLDKTAGVIEVMLQKTDGSFAPPIKSALGAECDFTASGQLDGDGKLDAVCVSGLNKTVTVLLGNGDGTVRKGSVYATKAGATAPVLADVSGDGKLDLLIPNSGANSVSLFIGTGSGTFGSPSAFTVGTRPVSAVATDLNHDGKVDIVVANSGSGDVTLLLGAGGGTFGTAKSATFGPSPTSLVEGDFNSDGVPDLAAASCGTSNGALVMLGKGDGTFDAATLIATVGCPESVAAGDYDHDGKLDLAVLHTPDADGTIAAEQVLLLLGNDDGTFTTGLEYYAAQSGFGMVTVDMDGNGRPDLILKDGQDTTVLINRTQ